MKSFLKEWDTLSMWLHNLSLKFNELIVAKKKIPGTPSSNVQDDTQTGEAWIFNWQELLISLFVESWIFK